MAIRKGTLRAFDSAAYTATVQVAGSLGGILTAVPVSRGIAAAAMVNGRIVAVEFFGTGQDPTDALVLGVF